MPVVLFSPRVALLLQPAQGGSCLHNSKKKFRCADTQQIERQVLTKVIVAAGI